jgi:hypothetical protein
MGTKPFMYSTYIAPKMSLEKHRKTIDYFVSEEFQSPNQAHDHFYLYFKFIFVVIASDYYKTPIPPIALGTPILVALGQYLRHLVINSPRAYRDVHALDICSTTYSATC